MECELCNKICKNTKGLSEHLKIHDITLFDYLNRSRVIPKCPICNNNCKKYQNNFRLTCGNKDCLAILSKNRKHSDLVKDKLRLKRIEYLQKKTGKTAWERRSRKEMSYLENWFQEEVILKFSLQDKHQIITEYHVDGYFIDFAFLNKTIAVEIDGRCHFDKNMKRHERDFKKDEVLKASGWNVIRMNFHDIRHNHEDLIRHFLNLLDTDDSQSCEWLGQVRYSDFKTQKILLLKDDKKEARMKFLCQKKEEINQSQIDFTKHGWVQRVSQIIGITPQKTRAWLEKNMPEIIEQSFRRT